MAMAIRDGLKFGATFSWGKFLILPGSVSALPTSIGRPCKPTTTPKARWKKRGNICRRRTNSRNQTATLTASKAGIQTEIDVSSRAKRGIWVLAGTVGIVAASEHRD